MWRQNDTSQNSILDTQPHNVMQTVDMDTGELIGMTGSCIEQSLSFRDGDREITLTKSAHEFRYAEEFNIYIYVISQAVVIHYGDGQVHATRHARRRDQDLSLAHEQEFTHVRTCVYGMNCLRTHAYVL